MTKWMMMVVAFVAALAAAPMVSAQDAPAAQRVGVVDLQRALNTVEEGQSARARLEADLEERAAEFQAAEAALRTEVAEFQAAAPMLEQDAAMQTYQELQERALALQTQYEEHQMSIAEAEAEATADIAEGMIEIVEEIAQEQGYTMVLDRGSVVFAGGDDLTDELIRRYDERH